MVCEVHVTAALLALALLQAVKHGCCMARQQCPGCTPAGVSSARTARVAISVCGREVLKACCYAGQGHGGSAALQTHCRTCVLGRPVT